jgi:hypothetical protein
MENEYVQLIRRMIEDTRADNEDLIMSLPNKAETDAQRELQAKHGTPREFAQACVNAIGEITCLEAHTAIERMLKRWLEAGGSSGSAPSPAESVEVLGGEAEELPYVEIKQPHDCPVSMSHAEGVGWSVGYNDAMHEVRRSHAAHLAKIQRLETALRVIESMDPYLGHAMQEVASDALSLPSAPLES